MTLKPFDRELLRKLASVYADSAVEQLLNPPNPVNTGKKRPHSRRVQKQARNRK